MVEDPEIAQEEAFYKSEIQRDLHNIDKEKNRYIKQVKSGLGEELKNFNSYIKPTPSRWKMFKNKVKRILWSV